MNKQNQDKSLYFIALVPDEPIYSEIWQLKEEVRGRFGSQAALRSPPHITLHMPFKWRVTKEEHLLTALMSLANNNHPFKLNLNGFGAFEPRVIYVEVEESNELTCLQKKIVKMASSEWNIYPLPGSRAFKPHLTIAFRDLRKAKFYEAWPEFKSRQYENSTLVNKLSLLKHNGKTWDVYKSFKLQKKAAD